MENLIQKLQTEAGLTKEQSYDTLKVIKEFMDNEGISIDWNKFVKGKYDHLSGEAKEDFQKISHKIDDWSDKVSDKVEDAGIKAKREIRDFSKDVRNNFDQ